MDEIRNELLQIKSLVIAIEKKKDINFYIDYLLDRFEIDLNRKKADLKHELDTVNENLKLLKNVRKEVLKNEK